MTKVSPISIRSQRNESIVHHNKLAFMFSDSIRNALSCRAHSTNKFLVNSFATQAKSASSGMMEIMAFLLSPFSPYFNIPSESAGMNQAEINTQTTSGNGRDALF